MSLRKPKMRALVAIVAAIATTMIAVGSPGTSSAATAPLPGLTEDSVSIGVVYIGDLGKSFEQLGAEPVTIGQLAVAKAIIQHFNDNGGLGGRTIKPVFYNFFTSGSSTLPQREQEMCSLFTEDNKTFAVTGFITIDETFVACASKAQTQYISNSYIGAPSFDSQTYKQYPQTVWQPSNTTTNLAWGQTVRALSTRGFFDKGAKIGLLNYDAPVWQRGVADAKAALKELGLKVTAEATIKRPSNTDETAQAAAQGQTAVLQFKTAGVTHVLVSSSAASPSNFYTVAEQQDYHPRYGLMTSGGGALAGTPDLATQLNNAMLVSWNPFVDLGAETERGAECAGWVTAAGASVTGAQNYANDLCDTLTFIDGALKKAGSTVTKSSFAKAAEQLPKSDAAMTIEMQVTKGQHAGTRVARVATHKDGCVPPSGGTVSPETSCWTYTGKPISMPTG